MAEKVNDIEDLRQRRKGAGVVELQSSDGHARVVNIEELTADDAEFAAASAYQPVSKRQFGYLSTFSFAVSISGLFSSAATTFFYPLHARGPSSTLWSWLISGAGCMVRPFLELCDSICAYET